MSSIESLRAPRAEISRFCTCSPQKKSQPLAPGVVTAHGARGRVAGEAMPCPCHLLLIAVNKGCHGAREIWPVSASALNSYLHVSTVNFIITVYLYISTRVSQQYCRCEIFMSKLPKCYLILRIFLLLFSHSSVQYNSTLQSCLRASADNKQVF